MSEPISLQARRAEGATGSATAFSAEQFDMPYSEGVEGHFWTYARCRIVERHIRYLTSRLGDPKSQILDIGCGVGLVVAHLRERGFSASGVEVGEPPIRDSVRAFVTPNTRAEDLPHDQRVAVRIITLLDVVEHIEDRRKFLRDLRATFPNLAYIVVTVPAGMELWSNFDEAYGHYLRFDKKGLCSLLNDEGFTPIVLKRFFTALYAPVWIATHLQKKRSLLISPPTGAARTFHAMLGQICALEERLPLGVVGTSLLAVART